MSNTKKYIVTSLTLCAIGAVAAIAIAGVNLLTRDRIASNTLKAQQSAMKQVFPDAISFTDPSKDFKVQNDYLVEFYVAYKDEAKTDELGYIYYVDGKNAYGEVALMVGVTEYGVEQISVVTNTESYASTLEEEYINKFQKGDIGLDDVKCGATYGATLIRDMAAAAVADYTEQVKGGN